MNNSSSTDKTISTHEAWIDNIKGILIIVIVFMHCGWKKDEEIRMFFPFWADLTVPLFMFVSGYVYSKSYKKNIVRIIDAYNIRFVYKKLMRYIMPFSLAFFVEYIICGVYDKNASLPWVYISGGGGPGGYYFPVMLQFVFIYPLIYFLVLNYKGKGVVCCFFIDVIYEVIVQCFVHISLENYRLLVFQYIFIIAFGCYYEMFGSMQILHSVFCSLIGLIYIYLLYYTGYTPKYLIFWSGRNAIAALSLIGVVPILNIVLSKSYFNSLGILGIKSWHIFLAQKVFYECYYTKLSNYFSRMECLFVSFFVCIICGIFFYYCNIFFEKIVKCLVVKIRNAN